MELRVIYDPALRRRAAPVKVFNQELKALSERMLAIMHQHRGVGLAANQLGIDKHLFVLEFRPDDEDHEAKPIPPLALCNARLVKASRERTTVTEGCLSLPGLELKVSRPSGVTVEAQTIDGRTTTIKTKGILARIIQHEIDHLDGRLFTDQAVDRHSLKNYTWAKIVFFGSDEFSEPIFDSLASEGLNTIAVITEADKPAGRGAKLTAPLMKPAALKHSVAVFQPATKAEITEVLAQLAPDLVVLASYGKILPAESLAIPVFGCLNVHPSLLPRYRGATPIQSAILAGESETGVTVMKMDPGIDTGEIIAQTRMALQQHETYPVLRKRLSELGAKLLLKSLPGYLSGQATPRAQTGPASSTTKLTKEMGELDFNDPPVTLERKIRALNPWPGTYTRLSGKQLKILAAHLEGKKLALERVQLEGKKPCLWVEFIRGHAAALKKTPWFERIS